MYDWANSAYNLVITTTIFPAYYDAITTQQDGNIIRHKVLFAGLEFESASLYNYTIAAAYLVIALLSPILSSIADYKGNKKVFLKFFCYVGGISCSMLFWFRSETLALGIICCMLAAIGYCGSLVFYNAYLPEIAADEDKDRISAKGFALGYVGSVILQLICFVFVLMPEKFGITDTTFGPRLSFLLVGIWWMSFAQIAFKRLPPGKPARQYVGSSLLANGFKELKKVWQQLKHMPVLKSFLSAFFFYSMGVQTVMLAATLFASQVIGLPTPKLIIALLIIQLVAIAGAYGMAALSRRLGNIMVLMLITLFWICICIAAYFITTEMEFYILAVCVGLVMGGVQSLSRSTYGKIMPATHDTASFFSFYDVTEKIAIVIGMFSFGVVQQVTGNMRNSVIALILFFFAGLLLLVLTYRKQQYLAVKI